MSKPTVKPGQTLYVPAVLQQTLKLIGLPMDGTFDTEESRGQVGVLPVYAVEADAVRDYPNAYIMEIYVPGEVPA